MNNEEQRPPAPPVAQFPVAGTTLKAKSKVPMIVGVVVALLVARWLFSGSGKAPGMLNTGDYTATSTSAPAPAPAPVDAVAAPVDAAAAPVAVAVAPVDVAAPADAAPASPIAPIARAGAAAGGNPLLGEWTLVDPIGAAYCPTYEKFTGDENTSTQDGKTYTGKPIYVFKPGVTLVGFGGSYMAEWTPTGPDDLTLAQVGPPPYGVASFCKFHRM